MKICIALLFLLLTVYGEYEETSAGSDIVVKCVKSCTIKDNVITAEEENTITLSFTIPRFFPPLILSYNNSKLFIFYAHNFHLKPVSGHDPRFKFSSVATYERRDKLSFQFQFADLSISRDDGLEFLSVADFTALTNVVVKQKIALNVIDICTTSYHLEKQHDALLNTYMMIIFAVSFILMCMVIAIALKWGASQRPHESCIFSA